MRSSPGTSSICGEFVKISNYAQTRCQRQHVSIAVVPTFERAFKLDADVICWFLSKDCGEEGSAISRLLSSSSFGRR